MYKKLISLNETNDLQPSQLIQNTEKTKNGVCKRFLHQGQCDKGETCPYSHDYGKIKPCANFQTNSNCKYGYNCDFSHSEPQTQVCVFFAKGLCKNGDSCTFKHPYTSCKFYDLGFCYKGPMCEYEHVCRKLCNDYTYGYCAKGPKCDKVHPKVFSQNDFQFTADFYRVIKDIKNQFLFECKKCHILGHKANKCIMHDDNEYKATSLIVCGYCDQEHLIKLECPEKKRRKLMEQQ